MAAVTTVHRKKGQSYNCMAPATIFTPSASVDPSAELIT